MKQALLTLISALLLLTGNTSEMVDTTGLVVENTVVSSLQIISCKGAENDGTVEGISSSSPIPEKASDATLLRNIINSGYRYPSTSFYDPENPVVDYDSLILPDDILDHYKEEDIIIYSKSVLKPPKNIALWNKWVDCFINGEPCRILLYLDGYGFPSGAFELIANGTDAYIIREFPSRMQLASFALEANDFEQRFGPDLPETYSTIYTKPIDVTVLDLKDGVDLGEISPQKAVSLAKARLTAISEARPEYAGPPDANWKIEITGAISLYGHPCYIIKSFSPQYDIIWDKEMAVNADGGNLFFVCNEMDGAWDLMQDTNMYYITHNNARASEMRQSVVRQYPSDQDMLETGSYFDAELARFIGYDVFEKWIQSHKRATVYDLIDEFNITDEQLKSILVDYVYEDYIKYRPQERK